LIAYRTFWQGGRRSSGGDGLGAAGRAWWLWEWLEGWVEVIGRRVFEGKCDIRELQPF